MRSNSRSLLDDVGLAIAELNKPDVNVPISWMAEKEAKPIPS
jgi:hypothetical protein